MMLERYLSVLTKGTCNGEENGTFSVKDYDTRQAYATGSIKGIPLIIYLQDIVVIKPVCSAYCYPPTYWYCFFLHR